MSAAPAPLRTFDRGSVSHDAAWSLAYSAAIRLSTFGLLVIVARRLGPQGAGAIGIALQLTALATMIASLNLPLSLARGLAETKDEARRRGLLLTSGRLVLATGAISALVLLAGSGLLARLVYRDSSLAPVLAWCGPLVAVTVLQIWTEGALQGVRRFDALARWGVALSLVDLALGAFSAAFGVVGVLASRAVTRLGAVAFAFTRWLSGSGSPRSGPDPLVKESLTGSLLGFAGPALVSSVVALLGSTLLRIELVRRVGLDAAGIFQAGDSLAQGLVLIPNAAAAAFMPAVSREHVRDSSRLGPALRRGLSQVSGFNLALSLGLMGLWPWLVGTVFGAGFEAAGAVLVLLALSYGLAGLGTLFGAVLIGRGEVWRAVALNTAWAATVFLVFGLGASRWGAMGAAAALASGYAILLAGCVLVLAPSWSVRVDEILPPVAANALALGLGATLALSPAVPAPVTAIVCGAMALGAFVRWGLPTLPARLRGARA